MPILRRLPYLAAVLLLSLTACTSPPPTGSVQFAASVPQALSANDVTRVRVTVSAADMSSLVVELARSNGSWGGLIGNIPAGSDRSFLAEAFDSSDTLRFRGQALGVTITANQTTAVALTLQEISPPAPYGNEAPLIDSAVAAPTSIQTGGSVSLTSAAHDPNTGDTLTYAWSASSGTFSTPTATSTSWTAPSSAGVQLLTLTVTDSHGAAVSVSLAVNVSSGVSTGDAALNISFNLWPVVSQVSASLNRLDAGQPTAVSATASDADGDSLSYAWASSCPGTWMNEASSSASFVPSSVPASACNNCRLTVTVQDGRGGQTTGFINLCIAAASVDRFAPRVTNFYQSATAISANQPVAFDVTALDPQSSAMTFAWTANTGSLAAAQTNATTSRVVWTAPWCAPTGGPSPSITATVTNAYGLSASKSFAVSGLPACAASGWAPAAAMSTGRYHHTATVLDSGKVLVAGGYTGSSALSSSELYDPATNSWASTAPLASARYRHTATRLPSGKVLIAGGYTGSSALAAPELYDPATNSWSSAGTMASARYAHTAILLTSGKVLVSGGNNGSGAVASSELYDPATNSWSSAAPMSTARSFHSANLLASGKVLVSGGENANGQLSTAEVYDPATNAWSSAGSLSTPLSFHTTTLLPSGKVLSVGGFYIIARTYVQLYDPATNAWSSVAYMATPHVKPSATVLASGKVLVAGGDASNGPTASSELYDPATNSWSSAGNMSAGRSGFTATLLLSGQVLILGGFNAPVLSSADLYTP